VTLISAERLRWRRKLELSARPARFLRSWLAQRFNPASEAHESGDNTDRRHERAGVAVAVICGCNYSGQAANDNDRRADAFHVSLPVGNSGPLMPGLYPRGGGGGNGGPQCLFLQGARQKRRNSRQGTGPFFAPAFYEFKLALTDLRTSVGHRNGACRTKNGDWKCHNCVIFVERQDLSVRPEIRNRCLLGRRSKMSHRSSSLPSRRLTKRI